MWTSFYFMFILYSLQVMASKGKKWYVVFSGGKHVCSRHGRNVASPYMGTRVVATDLAQPKKRHL
ncbi:hypothetical protein Scep_014802 [Stephania cephalantha]|uniref:Secreted protein n=1 Tax=Stephania cephalantha TaxID=152367 RepID=A0AAP0J4J0_9MAGN